MTMTASEAKSERIVIMLDEYFCDIDSSEIGIFYAFAKKGTPAFKHSSLSVDCVGFQCNIPEESEGYAEFASLLDQIRKAAQRLSELNKQYGVRQ